MENIICSCLKCGLELGSFRNSWIGIGNSYFSPVYPPVAYINGVVATGEVFTKGPDGSAVQNSVLQDLACRKCATVIGLRCDDAPDGHLLKKNQLILRLAEMNVVSEQTGERATVSVQEKIPLVAAGVKKLPAVRRAATVQPTPRAQRSGSLVEYGKQKSTNGNMLPPPAEDSSRKNSAKFATWTEDAINSQQKDIDRMGGALARIEKDMKSFKEFMAEVRAELAANRATRKTQEDLKQEQLAWLQEDLKELRQENGDFQQDMREEELPSIHNELEQLRQELDSTNRFTELPSLGSLPPIDELKGLKESVMQIDHKVNEVDGLKTELQRLQRRLTGIENKRPEPFVFPRTLMDHPKTYRPSPADSQMRSVSTIARQQPRLMFEAPNDVASRSMTARLVSPTPPGAFPNSIMDLDTPHRNLTFKFGTITSKSKPQRSENEPKVSETASPKPILVQKWSYTGPRRWRGVKSAFQTFGIAYPKLGAVSESIKVLEDHVNTSKIQNSHHAQEHGKVILVEESNQNQFEDEPESSLPKRKHDQVDNATEQSPSETVTKRRKRSSIVAENCQSSTPEQHVEILISSDHGSPELGRESTFRFGLDKANVPSYEPERALEPMPGSLLTLKQRRSSGRLRNSYLGGDRSSNGPCTSSPVHNTAIWERMGDGQQVICGEGGNPSSIFPMPTSEANGGPLRQRAVSNKENEMLPPAQRDRTAPKKTIASQHKNPTPFNDHEDDAIAKDFRCPTCKRNFGTQEGLEYHISHSTCRDSQDEQTKGLVAAWNTRTRKSLERLHLVSPGKATQRDAQLAGGTEHTPKFAVPREQAAIPSIEVYDGPMPGSFPHDIDTPASTATDMRSSTMQGTELGRWRPYKCGGCGKRYANIGSLKYHKEHSSCSDHPDDVIPAVFKCPSCNKTLSHSGLKYHLAVSAACRDAKKGKGEKKVAAEYDEQPTDEEEQKRKELLAARERLVKEVLDRE